jgi:hypothetical protein
MPSISVKVTLPKKKFSDIRYQDTLQNELSKIGDDMVSDFEKTIEGWKDAPDFKWEFIDGVVSIGVRAKPYGRGLKQYRIVNFGSPPHLITAKRPGGKLKFRHGSGYVPSTRVGSLSSNANANNGTWVSTYSVFHHGFEGRQFSAMIRDKYKPTFQEDMQKAINLSVKQWEG